MQKINNCFVNIRTLLSQKIRSFSAQYGFSRASDNEIVAIDLGSIKQKVDNGSCCIYNKLLTLLVIIICY